MRSSRWALSVLVILVTGVWQLARVSAQRPSFEVIIAHGRIVDGNGATAATRVDAANLVVSPGFIDLLGQSEFNVLVDGRAASKILQGVTTEVTGEGSSIA